MNDKGICEGERRFSLWDFCLLKFTALGLEVVLVVQVFKLNKLFHLRKEFISWKVSCLVSVAAFI